MSFSAATWLRFFSDRAFAQKLRPSVNAKQGLVNEILTQKELEKRYGKSQVLSQVTILDERGKRWLASDGKGRRADAVVIKQGKVSLFAETTSYSERGSSRKASQLRREMEAISSGKCKIRLPSGELVKIPKIAKSKMFWW